MTSGRVPYDRPVVPQGCASLMHSSPTLTPTVSVSRQKQRWTLCSFTEDSRTFGAAGLHLDGE